MRIEGVNRHLSFESSGIFYIELMKKGLTIPANPFCLFGGAERDRTVGLQSAILALSQLSYCPSIEVEGSRFKAEMFLPES